MRRIATVANLAAFRSAGSNLSTHVDHNLFCFLVTRGISTVSFMNLDPQESTETCVLTISIAEPKTQELIITLPASYSMRRTRISHHGVLTRFLLMGLCFMGQALTAFRPMI